MFRTSLRKALAAVSGALLLSQSPAAPASAFTLASPPIGEHFSSAQIENAYWCRWGHCGGYGWGRWGWGYRGYYAHPYYGYGYHRHCWMSPWGWRCGW